MIEIICYPEKNKKKKLTHLLLKYFYLNMEYIMSFYLKIICKYNSGHAVLEELIYLL